MLIKSPTKKAFVKNLKTEIKHGKPKKQALAIAYSVKRGSQPGDLYNTMKKKETAAQEKRHGKKHEAKESAKMERTEHKNWIAGAIKKPGALRASLGIKEGKTIPGKKLAAAAKKGGKLGMRARLAETLKGFSKKSKKADMYSKYKKMTLAEDTAYDKKHGIKEHSPEDMVLDKLHGVKDKKMYKKTTMCKKCKSSKCKC